MGGLLHRRAGKLPHARSEPGAPASVRVLQHADTAALKRLVDVDPVSNVFMASHLHAAGTAASTGTGGHVLGYGDGGELSAACWVGVNVVPVCMSAGLGPAFADALVQSPKRFSSIFGPAEAVLSIWERLRHSVAEPFDVRPSQPLLQIQGPPAVEPAATLRPAVEGDFHAVLPAAAAMFEEEVGYSPLTGNGSTYRQRVLGLIRQGHTFVDFDGDGNIIFKADLGTVSPAVSQIQGVWLSPRYRGRGLAAGYMAAVVEGARRSAPPVSLYVNDYNHRARRVYEAVGFRQTGLFATVLL